MSEEGRFTDGKRRLKPGTLVLIALFHLAVFYGLARALAPDITRSVEDSVLSTFSVTVTAPPPPPPPPAQENSAPDEGAAGAPAPKATPREVAAPTPRVPVPRPSAAPRAASTGRADRSGAADAGAGTGAAGAGSGTGAGGQGSGAGGGGAGTGGGGVAVRPSVRSGELNTAADFPTPPGGRQTRFGKSVTVSFTVTTDGRAKDCSVARSEVDAEATARVCPLVMQKIRFNPAKTADGTLVETRYGYRVDFRPR